MGLQCRKELKELLFEAFVVLPKLLDSMLHLGVIFCSLGHARKRSSDAIEKLVVVQPVVTLHVS